jgi:hypothetical protein
MSEPLATYLRDHLAGSNFAIELLKSLRDKHKGEAGRVAAAVLPEIQKDRDTLQKIIDQVGRAPVDLKEAAAWVTEKVSRLKLTSDDPGGLGTFEAIEALALGILGKLSLWSALKVVAGVDPRIVGTDFDELSKRAKSQHHDVEYCRLQLARAALAPALGK